MLLPGIPLRAQLGFFFGQAQDIRLTGSIIEVTDEFGIATFTELRLLTQGRFSIEFVYSQVVKIESSQTRGKVTGMSYLYPLKLFEQARC